MPPSDEHVNPPNKVALVIGGNGVTGCYLNEHLLSEPASSWARVISISRKPPFKEWLKEMRDIPGSGIKDEDIAKMSKDGGSSGRLHWVCSDLLVDSMDEVANKLEAVGGDKITHVFYAGYVVIDGWMGKKERAANAKLFDVGVGAAAKIAAKSLRRICVQTGAKAYGFHVQHTKCPLTEADPWHPVGADFYIDQVESAKRLSEASGGQFDWVVTVPSGIWGFSRSSFMNSATTWALYCAVQAHRGVELSFNGSIERWLVGNDFVDAMHLAKFDVWCGTTAKCGGEYFNASNGSVYTWEWMWPIFCEYFGAKMPELDPETMAPKRIVSVQKEMTGMVLPTPASTTQLDVDLSTAKESDAVGTPNHVAVNAWKEMCEKYPNMDPDAINWATWWFVEFGSARSYKMILLNFDKARKFGFHSYIDPKTSVLDTFERMKRAGALPPFVGQQGK